MSAQFLSMNNSFINYGNEESILTGDYEIFNGIIVGAPDYSNSQGRAYIFIADGSIQKTAANADRLLEGDGININFGSSVDGAININGDEFDDVIVGAYGENKSYVYLGSENMVTAIYTKPATQGAQDTTGDDIADLKFNDGSGSTGYYTVTKGGAVLFIDTFDVTGLMGTVTKAVLHVQYYTDGAYPTSSNLYVQWALEGQALSNTDIEIVLSNPAETNSSYNCGPHFFA